MKAENGSGGWLGKCLRGCLELLCIHMGCHKAVNVSSPLPIAVTPGTACALRTARVAPPIERWHRGRAGLAFTLLPTPDNPAYEMQTLVVRYFGTGK